MGVVVSRRVRALLGEALFRLAPRRRPGAGPDFVCIGLPKAGTRWLFDQMVGRPDVWMPPIKEISFLNGIPRPSNDARIGAERARLRERGPLLTDVARQRRFLDLFADHAAHVGDLDWYRRLFDMKGGRRSGDVSPAYSGLSDARIAEVAEALPETRFILLLREPAERLWSSLCMNVRAGRLAPAVLEDWSLLSHHLGERRPRSRYPSEVWRAWSAALPAGRIRFWFLEDIVERPEQVVDGICRHVGIAPGPGRAAAGYNRKRNNPKISLPPDIAARLGELFAEERRLCAEIFGGRAADWPGR